MRKIRSKHPDSIGIMGATFDIKYVRKLKDEDGEDLSGEMHGDKRLIKINLAQHDTDEIFERTLLHETIHAVLHMTGQTELLSEKSEEALVVALENGLSPLYKRR